MGELGIEELGFVAGDYFTFKFAVQNCSFKNIAHNCLAIPQF